MSRQIKFRVWDKINSKFLPFTAEYGKPIAPLIDIHGRLYNWSSQHWGMDNELENQDNYEIQQFTGLTDKNGKEIYEGDVMTGRNTPIVVEYQPPEFRFVYKNTDGGFCFRYVVGWGDFDGEVIGNVCENSELLK